MDQYAEVIGDNATTLDYRSIASYYQRTGHHFKAGTFFLKAKDYEHALHHFLHCSGALYPDGEKHWHGYWSGKIFLQLLALYSAWYC